jgi:acetyl-CoA carboxylase carboxyl transferase subunit alpha
MNEFVLDFERPIAELEKKIQDMKDFSSGEDIELSQEIKRLEKRAEKLRQEIFRNLTPWQRVQLARHPKRPFTLDYIKALMEDFVELHGDRRFSDDKAIVAGVARFEGRPVVVVGHQKGRNTEENLQRNFGMAHPEGYRKALRIFLLAAKFMKPVIVFIDTMGAYPGIGAEERGQAEAIATNLKVMSQLPVPIIIAIIGEGASGGALGIGVGDRILMLENAWYSVISPEGCAAILWRDRAQASKAAGALKLTAQDLMALGVIDAIVPEPLGGAHRDYKTVAEALRKELIRSLEELSRLNAEELVAQRLEKFGRMGFVVENNEGRKST